LREAWDEDIDALIEVIVTFPEIAEEIVWDSL
jgi:hypothetical protein